MEETTISEQDALEAAVTLEELEKLWKNELYSDYNLNLGDLKGWINL